MALINNFSFSAFVITYKRPKVLVQTIQSIFKQTLVPEKLLIVDNDPEQSAHSVLSELEGLPIEYYSVGFNSGPAGAAHAGLKNLFVQGYQWVLWLDDDDPPRFEDQIEVLASNVIRNQHVANFGMTGSVGQFYNNKKGEIVRVSNETLLKVEDIEVDQIAGNMFPFVSRKVFEAGVLPNNDIFFGFEELEFCLRVQNAGFKIIISGKEMHRHRELSGRLNFKRSLYTEKQVSTLWREYYGMRTLVKIVTRVRPNIIAFIRCSLKCMLKIFIGFKFGLKYGLINFKYIFLGYIHGLVNKKGLTILPIKKSL
jgi:glycosyltransferase involved in cell wall biosynthesis